MASKTAATPLLDHLRQFKKAWAGCRDAIKCFVYRVFDRHARSIRQASDINSDFRVLYPEDFRIEAIWQVPKSLWRISNVDIFDYVESNMPVVVLVYYY